MCCHVIRDTLAMRINLPHCPRERHSVQCCYGMSTTGCWIQERCSFRIITNSTRNSCRSLQTPDVRRAPPEVATTTVQSFPKSIASPAEHLFRTCIRVRSIGCVVNEHNWLLIQAVLARASAGQIPRMRLMLFSPTARGLDPKRAPFVHQFLPALWAR